MTTIDLSRTSGLIALGTHTFKITERSSEEMGQSGFPYWRLICKVISPGENQGKELMYQMSLSPQSRFRVDAFLDAIGAPERGSLSLEQCVGKIFRASVGQEPYDGKLRSVIAEFLPVSDAQISFDAAPSEIAKSDAALPSDVVGDSEPQSETSRRRFG